MPANDRQVGGDHYKKFGILQHWDVVVHFKLDYFQSQIIKYVMRHKDKGGLADLKKAQHFLEKYIELEEQEIETEAKHHLAQNKGVERHERCKCGTYALPYSWNKFLDTEGIDHTQEKCEAVPSHR